MNDHHVYVHFHLSPELATLGGNILALLRGISTKQDKLMINLDQLKASIARLQASDTAALNVLQQVRDQNAAMAKQLSDLQAGDPQIQSQIDDLANQAKQSADAIDAAVANNPQTPDLPPAA